MVLKLFNRTSERFFKIEKKILRKVAKVAKKGKKEILIYK